MLFLSFLTHMECWEISRHAQIHMDNVKDFIQKIYKKKECWSFHKPYLSKKNHMSSKLSFLHANVQFLALK